MDNNTGGFNAPSREAIYYRINKLAYGKDWEYDYEDFVEYDAINRSASAESVSVARSRRSNYVEVHVQPTAPPVVVGKSWRDIGDCLRAAAADFMRVVAQGSEREC